MRLVLVLHAVLLLFARIFVVEVPFLRIRSFIVVHDDGLSLGLNPLRESKRSKFVVDECVRMRALRKKDLVLGVTKDAR